MGRGGVGCGGVVRYGRRCGEGLCRVCVHPTGSGGCSLGVSLRRGAWRGLAGLRTGCVVGVLHLDHDSVWIDLIGSDGSKDELRKYALPLFALRLLSQSAVTTASFMASVPAFVTACCGVGLLGVCSLRLVCLLSLCLVCMLGPLLFGSRCLPSTTTYSCVVVPIWLYVADLGRGEAEGK